MKHQLITYLVVLLCILCIPEVRAEGSNLDPEAAVSIVGNHVVVNDDDVDDSLVWDKAENGPQPDNGLRGAPSSEPILEQFTISAAYQDQCTCTLVVNRLGDIGAVRLWKDAEKKVEFMWVGSYNITAVSKPITFWVEGLTPTANYKSVGFDASYTVTNKAGKSANATAEIMFGVTRADADADTENNGEIETGDDKEDKEEYSLRSTHPGKFIQESAGDVDNDGLLDCFEKIGLGATGSSSENAVPNNLVPMKLTLHTPHDPSRAMVTFHYSSSIPRLGEGIEETVVNGVTSYQIKNRGMRLWTVNGGARTSGKDVGASGQFIPSGTPIPWSAIQANQVYIEYVDKPSEKSFSQEDIVYVVSEEVPNADNGYTEENDNDKTTKYLNEKLSPDGIRVSLVPAVGLEASIVRFTNETLDLPDDSKANGSEPHDMDPGSLVLAPIQEKSYPGSRSKLTLKVTGGSVANGTFKLTAQNLDKVAIYDAPEGGTRIPLEKNWQASAFPGEITYYVGALPFGAQEPPQDGNLTFSYVPPSADGNAPALIQDQVRVRLEPANVDLSIASIGNEDALPEDKTVDGSEVSAPHEMEPGSLVVAPVNWRVTPATRSKLELKAEGAVLNEGKYTLTSVNLSKIAIYDENDNLLEGDALTWSSLDFAHGKTLYVGAQPFKPVDQAQDGTLTLTYSRAITGSSTGASIQASDAVRVRLEPLAVDLKIVRFSNDADDLAEDDVAGTSPVPPPHEMDPGSIVLAPVDGSPHPPGYRSRLTLTRSENASAIGTITLSAEELNNVAIYDDEQRFEDFRKVNLPKQWEVADFVNGLVMHVGSNPFATDAAAQDGTLTLTQRVSAAKGLPYVEIKDVVRVTLNPLAVDLAIASIGNEPYLAEDRKLDGFTAPTPHELSPGSFVFIPVEGDPSSGTRSKLNLTAVRTAYTNGTYTLTAQNLSKVAIYNTAIGGTPLDLNSLSWNSAQFGNGKTFYVGGQSFTAYDDAQNGTLTFSFQESTSQNPIIMIEDKVRVRLVPMEVKVVKEGETAAPEDGLIVKKTDTVRYRLSPGMPDTPLLLEDKIQWHWRILKLDGSYGEWTPYIDGQGHTFTARPKDAGIYEVKAVLNGQDFLFSRKSDAPHADPSKGDVQAIHKKGAHDCLGVVDEDWQIRLRVAAKNHLGSERWAEAVELVLENASNFPPGSDKCNAFIYEQGHNAGTPVPLKEKFGLSTWPPIAFDWWNDNTGRLDNAGRTMTSEPILGWQRLLDNTNPQPGFVVSRPDLSGDPPKYHSHVGILDYDGSWISAGRLKVNKYYHPSSMELDSVTGLPKNIPYQPQGYRKYVGTP